MHRQLSVLAALLGIGVFAVLLNAQNAPIDAAGPGSLYVTQSVTPIRARQFLGGTTGDVAMRVTLRAEGEGIGVTRLRFTNVDGGNASVERLDLYVPGQTTPFGSATVAACGTDPVPAFTFCFARDPNRPIKGDPLLVKIGTQQEVLVRPVIKTDVSGAVSGHGVRLRAYPEDTSSLLDGAVAGRGIRSQVVLAANDGDGLAEGEVFIGRSSPAASGANVAILGTAHKVSLAKFTDIVNASPDPNGTAIPTGIMPMGQFKMTAAPNTNSKNGLNKIGVTTVIFTVASTNVSIDASSFKGYNKADPSPSSQVNCFAYNANGGSVAGATSGNLFVSCAFSGSPANNMIDQNTNQTFVLQGNILNPKISSSQASALQVSIQNFSDPTQNSGVSIPTSHFGWQDTDSGNTNVFFWVDHPETTVKSTMYQG